MGNGLNISASGAREATNRASVAAHNIANSRTPGFMQRRLESRGIPAGGGVKAHAVSLDIRGGGLVQTGNPLDLAISGVGFLRFQGTNGGVLFSRDGSLKISPGGQLVNADGYPLIPPVNLPENSGDIQISADGIVQVTTPGGIQEAGRIALSRFQNIQGLESAGGNVFAESAASGAPVTGQPGNNGLGQVVQGFLEKSNVDPIQQQVSLIEARQSLAANVTAIRTFDDMARTVVDLKR